MLGLDDKTRQSKTNRKKGLFINIRVAMIIIAITRTIVIIIVIIIIIIITTIIMIIIIANIGITFANFRAEGKVPLEKVILAIKDIGSLSEV